MKQFAFLLACLILLPIRVQAQERPVGVDVSVHGSFLAPPASAYQDPEISWDRRRQPRPDYGWLNEVDRGLGGEGRLILRLPFGLSPFVGYHSSSLHEGGIGEAYWSHIYEQPIGESDRFEPKRREVNYRTRGFSAGFLFALPELDSVVRPYLLSELRTEQLRATTRVTGFARDFYTSNPWTGSFEGRSEMGTETTFGVGLGVGLQVSLSQLLPFGGMLERAALVPEVEYVLMRDAQIANRYFEWDIDSIDPRSEVQSHPTTFDRQEIEMEYFEFRLGLRYEIF